jgi:uncharacterized protein involved in exopolysaccharide biosynthesis
MLAHRQLAPEEYLAIVRRRFWILFLPALVFSVGAYLYSRTLPRPYTSETLVLVNQPHGTDAYVDLVADEQLNQRLASMQDQILSRSRLQAIAEQFHLVKPNSTIEDTIDGLQKAIVVSPIIPLPTVAAKNVPGFRISVTMSSPQLAQQVCSTVTSLFLKDDAPTQAQGGGTAAFLDSELAEAKKKLDVQDKILADYQQAHIGQLPTDTQANLATLAGLRARLEQVTREIDRAQQDKAFAETQLASQLSAWQTSQVVVTQNPHALEEQLAKLQDDLADLQSRYTPDYPDVVRAKADIADLEGRIARAKSSEKEQVPPAATAAAEPPEIGLLRNQLHQDEESLSENTTEEKSIQKQIDDYDSRIKVSPVVDQQFKELTRDYQSALDFYNDTAKRRDNTTMANDLSAQQQNGEFRVLDPASLPEMPSSTFGMQYAGAGGGGGLFLGLLVTLVIEYRDKSIRTERDAEFFLESPVVALVPQFKVSKPGERAAGTIPKEGSAEFNGLNPVA